MSKCGDISGRLPAFALGELDEALAGEVASHLRECAACAREAGRLRQTVDLLTSSLKESEPAVAGLSAARIAEIHRGGRRRSQQAGVRWIVQSHPALAAAAAVAAVAGAGWLLVAGLRPWPREAAVAERLTAQPAAAKPPVVLAAAAPSTHGNARETDAPGDAAEAALSPAPSLEQPQPSEPAMAFSLDVAASGPMARDEAGDKAAPSAAAEMASPPASAPAPVALARRAEEPAARSSVAKAVVPLPRPSTRPSPCVTVQECVSPFDSARRLAILVLRSPENEKLDAAGGRLAGADKDESGARTLRIRFDGRQVAGVRGVGGAARAAPRREGDAWVVDVAVGAAAGGRPQAFLYEWTPAEANERRRMGGVRSGVRPARADDGLAAMAAESLVVEDEAGQQAIQPVGPGVIEVSVDAVDLRIERAGESGADDGAAARVAALLREALPDDPEAGAVLDAMRRAGWIE